MKHFLLDCFDPEGGGIEVTKEAFESYREYLASVKDRLPKRAFELVSAPWYFDITDHQYPHDSWVEELRIREVGSGDRHEIRTTEIHLTVLGAYHDRTLTYSYFGVHAYSISSRFLNNFIVKKYPNHELGFGDWMLDEFFLTERGNLGHIIRFRLGGKIKIECKDFAFAQSLFT